MVQFVGYGLVGLGWQYLQFNTTRIRYVKDMFLELSRDSESSPIPLFCLRIANMKGEQSRCVKTKEYIQIICSKIVIKTIVNDVGFYGGVTTCVLIVCY